ncbi:hypothetical protein [Bradyrhizobium sp. BR13661]|jgi:hypothetical protein|uniref:hypothetical protein n=1 Tax=Bradyrhizobium sp. BR13661 TaxID=2940622 RepID=UPI002476299C|nr:hypothetical protein [Bradyrhizobium sp. BR13661]MDH6258294.1 hypothetical protein [Bradyrhizobium sp. BR13661]
MMQGQKMRRLLIFALVFPMIFCIFVGSLHAQDEQCRTNPTPQCQCACRDVRSVVSFAPRGTCRIIEPGGGACQLRWFDAARPKDEKVLDPNAAAGPYRQFLDRVRSGNLPTKARDISFLRVELLEEKVKGRGIELPPGSTPTETAAAYLSLDPNELEPEPLLVALLILLGPGVSAATNDEVAAALVDYLANEPKIILGRLQSERPEIVSVRTGSLEFRDESARGCLELVISGSRPVTLMVKSPRAAGRSRCRE